VVLVAAEVLPEPELQTQVVVAVLEATQVIILEAKEDQA
jgi:hypothetical protein